MRSIAFLIFSLAAGMSSLALLAAPEEGGPQVQDLAGSLLQRLRSARQRLGLDPFHDFIEKERIHDGLGLDHVRIEQTYRGLRVWGGQAILHLDSAGAEGSMTDALVRGIQLETTPNLEPGEAVSVAMGAMGLQGAATRPPETELVVWPEPDPGGDPDSVDPPAIRHHLAYHVHIEVERGGEDTRHQDLLVDAHTGALLGSWSTLFTFRGSRLIFPEEPRLPAVPAKAVGYSQYSGTVILDVMQTPFGFELTDPTRGNASTLDMRGLLLGFGEPYLAPTPSWGDGRNYDSGPNTHSPNGQTTAVDAHYGMQVTWDFYRNILGRCGIDGKGTGPISRVHYAVGISNAFWVDACMCMNFGDGVGAKPFTSLDVVGHEVTHGLCHATAGLVYMGESGGLNEANSDIFGVLVRAYARTAHGTGYRVPDECGDWTLGGDLQDLPMRYMFKPSLDGASPDEWSPRLRTLNPHQASGPMNRAFFFLAQGSSPDPASPAFSRHLPRGMGGIGNHKALLIWWRTLSTRLTPTSGYRRAREGALQSARELFGPGSPEVQAVGNAFKGINVPGRRR